MYYAQDANDFNTELQLKLTVSSSTVITVGLLAGKVTSPQALSSKVMSTRRS